MADEDPDLDRARQGDRDAFGRLVQKYQRRVYSAALHILGNHSDADDATQEAFVRAYRGLSTFDGRADFFTWLYRITINTALNALRSDKRGSALTQKSNTEAQHVGGRPEALGQVASNPAQQAQQTGEVARVLIAVSQLSASLRVTLVLATIEEMPHKQIAEVLEIPEGTVAWRVNEARRLLRLKLSGDDSKAATTGDGSKPTPATVK